MSNFNFENLLVYQRSLKLSIELIKQTKEFNFKYNRIRDQFIGATISVPLNIAEGSGRKSYKEKINFYKIAQSSYFECIPIVSICLELNLVEEETIIKWRDEISQICRMLSGLINNLKSLNTKP